MLTFAAIVPHSLDLLRTPKKAPATINALEKLHASFNNARPEVIITISPHGNILEKSFAINLAQAYELDLLELGVKTPKRTFKNDPLTTIAIRKARLTNADAPVTLVSTSKLDYGTAIPLSFLCKESNQCTIIPVSPSGHDFPAHIAMGNTIKEEVMASAKRFAVIASATFAHGNKGKLFDDSVIAALASDAETKKLLSITDNQLKKFDMCGLRPMLILMGILQGLPWTYEQLSYENAFDTGLLVAEFPLKT